MLRILPIRLLLAFALPGDLAGIPDPQLKLQFRDESLKPARMPARFHPYAHLHSLRRKVAIELLRFLTVLQSPLLELPCVCIHKSNLLKTRVVIASYNDHCSAPLSRALLVGWHHQSLLGSRSRHCHGINCTHCPSEGVLSVTGMFHQPVTSWPETSHCGLQMLADVLDDEQLRCGPCKMKGKIGMTWRDLNDQLRKSTNLKLILQ